MLRRAHPDTLFVTAPEFWGRFERVVKFCCGGRVALCATHPTARCRLPDPPVARRAGYAAGQMRVEAAPGPGGGRHVASHAIGRGVFVALLAAVLSAGHAAAQSCQPCWSDQFLSNELNAVVHTLAVFDADGAGPQRPRLHAGGLFLLAGGAAANFVARWDGTPREAVGGGPHRQKWTGAEWVPRGAGLKGPASALWPFDEDGLGPAAEALYVGGSFTRAGGAASNRIARWSGGTRCNCRTPTPRHRPPVPLRRPRPARTTAWSASAAAR